MIINLNNMFYIVLGIQYILQINFHNIQDCNYIKFLILKLVICKFSIDSMKNNYHKETNIRHILLLHHHNIHLYNYMLERYIYRLSYISNKNQINLNKFDINISIINILNQNQKINYSNIHSYYLLTLIRSHHMKYILHHQDHISNACKEKDINNNQNYQAYHNSRLNINNLNQNLLRYLNILNKYLHYRKLSTLYHNYHKHQHYHKILINNLFYILFIIIFKIIKTYNFMLPSLHLQGCSVYRLAPVMHVKQIV